MSNLALVCHLETWNECCTNEGRSLDSNRGTTNARFTRKRVLRTLFFKNARNPKFVQNLSQRLFWGGSSQAESGGLKFGKIFQNLSENYRFFWDKFWQIFPNFSPPDWNPPKQSLGQILDKFGVSGVFEGCKGEKGSQDSFLCFEKKSPKNLLRLFFASKIIHISWGFFKDPPKIPFKTSIKITSRGYFYFLRLYILPRGVIKTKKPQKTLREWPPTNASDSICGDNSR